MRNLIFIMLLISSFSLKANKCKDIVPKRINKTNLPWNTKDLLNFNQAKERGCIKYNRGCLVRFFKLSGFSYYAECRR